MVKSKLTLHWIFEKQLHLRSHWSQWFVSEIVLRHFPSLFPQEKHLNKHETKEKSQSCSPLNLYETYWNSYWYIDHKLWYLITLWNILRQSQIFSTESLRHIRVHIEVSLIANVGIWARLRQSLFLRWNIWEAGDYTKVSNMLSTDSHCYLWEAVEMLKKPHVFSFLLTCMYSCRDVFLKHVV